MGFRKRATLVCRAALMAWAAGFFWTPAAMAVVSIDFSPSAQTVDLGQPASVDIVISGLGDPTSPSLGDFDLNVTFDATILAPTGVIFGPFLGDPDPLVFETLTSVDFSAPGVVNFAEVSFLFDLSFQPASFPLATLTFDTLAAGVSDLELQINALGDENGASLTASVGTGSITVQDQAAVPEPGTLVLLGLGLAGVGVKSWRRGACRGRWHPHVTPMTRSPGRRP